MYHDLISLHFSVLVKPNTNPKEPIKILKRLMKKPNFATKSIRTNHLAVKYQNLVRTLTGTLKTTGNQSASAIKQKQWRLLILSKVTCDDYQS